MTKCYAISWIEAPDSCGLCHNWSELVSNCYYVGNAEDLSSNDEESTYTKHWTTYPEDGIVDINGGDFEYYVVNDLSKCQNGFPVLEWEADSFHISQLQKTSITEDSIGLTWSLIPRATGYEIYRCDEYGATMELLDTVNTNRYFDVNLDEETEYQYKVRSYVTENGHTFYSEFSDVMKVSTLMGYMPGDVDGNKSVELKDAQLTLKAALKIKSLDAVGTLAADVDGNGSVELRDAQLILKAALKISALPDKNKNSGDSNPESELSENAKLYYSYLNAEQVPAQGLTTTSQKKTIHEQGESWLDPAGILAAKIYDLDGDGEEEMLLMQVDVLNYNVDGIKHTIKMSVYEIENGKVVLADSTEFKSYNGYADAENQYLYDTEDLDHKLNVSIVNALDTTYIVCENYLGARCFGDGSYEEYWAMTYNDGKLAYEVALNQDSIGSFGCGYLAYMFNRGVLVKSGLVYGEEVDMGDTTLSDVGQMLFGNYGIKLNDVLDTYYGTDFQSIVSDENDIERVMDYYIRAIESDYQKSNYTFEAVLKDYTKLRNYVTE